MLGHQPDEGVFRSVLAEDVDWEPFAAFPPSARLAVVAGHPPEPGPYVVRVRLPSGVKLMPHWHHEDRVYTVISGVFYIGLGEQFEKRSCRPTRRVRSWSCRAAPVTSTGQNPVST
jgi:hypothetical protein